MNGIKLNLLLVFNQLTPFKLTDMKNLAQSAFSFYTVVYQFRHSSMGFQNSITVEALNAKEATIKASAAVAECYGSKMLKRFSFKEPQIKAK